MGTDSNNLLVPLLCNKYACMYILQFMNNWKCQISGYYLQHILGLTKNSLFSCGIISAIQYVLFSVIRSLSIKFLLFTVGIPSNTREWTGWTSRTLCTGRGKQMRRAEKWTPSLTLRTMYVTLDWSCKHTNNHRLNIIMWWG